VFILQTQAGIEHLASCRRQSKARVTSSERAHSVVRKAYFSHVTSSSVRTSIDSRQKLQRRHVRSFVSEIKVDERRIQNQKRNSHRTAWRTMADVIELDGCMHYRLFGSVVCIVMFHAFRYSILFACFRKKAPLLVLTKYYSFVPAAIFHVGCQSLPGQPVPLMLYTSIILFTSATCAVIKILTRQVLSCVCSLCRGDRVYLAYKPNSKCT
jgi:hypothetical protein